MIEHIIWRIAILLLILLVIHIIILIRRAIFRYKNPNYNVKNYIYREAIESAVLFFSGLLLWMAFLIYEIVKFHLVDAFELRNVNGIIVLILFVFFSSRFIRR